VLKVSGAVAGKRHERSEEEDPTREREFDATERLLAVRIFSFVVLGEVFQLHKRYPGPGGLL